MPRIQSGQRNVDTFIPCTTTLCLCLYKSMEKSAEDYTEICNTTQLVVGRNGAMPVFERKGERQREGGMGKAGRETVRDAGEGEDVSSATLEAVSHQLWPSRFLLWLRNLRPFQGCHPSLKYSIRVYFRLSLGTALVLILVLSSYSLHFHQVMYQLAIAG